MNFDFSKVSMADIIEYFSAMFKAFLKTLKIELPEGDFSINFGDVEIEYTETV